MSTPRITFDEAKCREFLEAQLEDEDIVGPLWSPRDQDYDDSTISQLMERAKELGVVSVPAHYAFYFIYDYDSDGGAYFWTVDVPYMEYENLSDIYRTLRLASTFTEMRKIGEPDAVGIEAAVALLSEGVHAANGLLNEFDQCLAMMAHGTNPSPVVLVQIDGGVAETTTYNSPDGRTLARTIDWDEARTNAQYTSFLRDGVADWGLPPEAVTKVQQVCDEILGR